jgi:hypothetical protein
MTLPSPIQLALGATAVFVAFTARGLSGFGSGMIAVPLLALLFPLEIVVPAVAILNYLASLRLGFKGRRLVAWRELVVLLPASLAGVGIALPLFHALSPLTLRRLLGGLLVLQSVRTLLGARPRRRSRAWALPIGVVGGAMDGLFSIGGPIYASYLELRELEKSAFRATLTTLLVLESSLRIVGYRATGFLDRRALLLCAAAVPAAIAGLLLGERLHGRLGEETFRRIVSGLILLSGLALLAT